MIYCGKLLLDHQLLREFLPGVGSLLRPVLKHSGTGELL